MNARIEKIVRVRFSRKRRWARELLVGQVQGNSRQGEGYGGEENTRMLVKWRGMDYTRLTWED
jgi:hypothetical protein